MTVTRRLFLGGLAATAGGAARAQHQDHGGMIASLDDPARDTLPEGHEGQR
jgi:hypothetical protein